MSRVIDHVVHAVHDLDAAADLYGRLGFLVGGRNRHPWGTHNRVVQLSGAYVELLTVAEPERVPPRADGAFSFGAFNRDFLKRGQGLSMVALAGRGATDSDTFRSRGIGDFSVFDFERESRKADGSPTRVAFSLAFASDPKAPHAGFFTCQHHNPENFWNAALQVHANTATTIAGIILVADNPSAHQAFLTTFAGEKDGRAGNGLIEVIDSAAFRAAFGVEPPDTRDGARLAAVRFAVHDLAAVRATLEREKIEANQRQHHVLVGPGAAMGATLVFEPAAVDPGPAGPHGPPR